MEMEEDDRSAETEAQPHFSMPAENRHLRSLCIKIEADVPPGQLPVELATGCSSFFGFQKIGRRDETPSLKTLPRVVHRSRPGVN